MEIGIKLTGRFGGQSTVNGCNWFNENGIDGLPSKLGTTYFTSDTKGINNGYPILKWELEIEN